MKIVKINDNLKINIEQIYSLERKTNSNEINDWNNQYQNYIDIFRNNPPEFIDNGEIIKITFGDNIDNETLEKYSQLLHNHILSIIGECPEYYETYYVILSTGLKISIGKQIYDKIDEYLNNFIEDKK